jgi:hypothetical protein
MQPDSPEPDVHAPEDLTPKGESEGQDISTKPVGVAPAIESNVATVPTTGKRQSVRNIARQLTDTDLSHLGVVKLIIENLDRAEIECETLQTYVERFHLSDKNCGILQEKLKTNTAIEVAFAVGVGLGCAIIGLAPSFWDGTYRGPMALGIGLLLVLGGIAVRVIKR